MAGGLFVFVRTAPPGGCALAITAGQYRPPMAHGPLEEHLEGPFLFCAAHSSCRNTASGAFSFFAACAILRCHAGLRFGIAILVFYLVLKSQCVTYFGLKPHRYADLQYLHLEYSNLAH